MSRTVRSPRSAVGIAAGGAFAALLALRHTQQGWGATPEEVDAVLPGDEILGPADLVATRAVGIQAPPEDVWPWLAQLGQGRGGFYSYDGLQSLLGMDIHNADEVVPEWQDIARGDVVKLVEDVALRVASVEPEQALVLRSPWEGEETGPQMADAPFAFTWAFVLRPGPRQATRLLVRERYTYLRPAAAALVETAQIASFIMSERMLRGIKERAEYRPPVEYAI